MQSLFDQLMDFAAAKRTEILDNCNNGITDQDLDPADRPNRAEVSPGCLVKPFDQLEIFGTPHLFLCPGRGIGWMYVLKIDNGLVSVGSEDVTNVTDRIPADPEEQPMPLFPEPA